MFISLCPVGDVKGGIAFAAAIRASFRSVWLTAPQAGERSSSPCDGGWS